MPDLHSSAAKQGTKPKASTAMLGSLPATQAAAHPLDHMAAHSARSAPPAAPRLASKAEQYLQAACPPLFRSVCKAAVLRPRNAGPLPLMLGSFDIFSDAAR